MRPMPVNTRPTSALWLALDHDPPVLCGPVL